MVLDPPYVCYYRQLSIMTQTPQVGIDTDAEDFGASDKAAFNS